MIFSGPNCMDSNHSLLPRASVFPLDYKDTERILNAKVSSVTVSIVRLSFSIVRFSAQAEISLKSLYQSFSKVFLKD